MCGAFHVLTTNFFSQAEGEGIRGLISWHLKKQLHSICHIYSDCLYYCLRPYWSEVSFCFSLFLRLISSLPIGPQMDSVSSKYTVDQPAFLKRQILYLVSVPPSLTVHSLLIQLCISSSTPQNSLNKYGSILIAPFWKHKGSLYSHGPSPLV